MKTTKAALAITALASLLAEAAEAAPITQTLTLNSSFTSTCGVAIENGTLTFPNNGGNLASSTVTATVTLYCTGADGGIPVSVSPTNGALKSGGNVIAYSLEVINRATNVPLRSKTTVSGNASISLGSVDTAFQQGTNFGGVVTNYYVTLDFGFQQAATVAPAPGTYSETLTVTFG